MDGHPPQQSSDDTPPPDDRHDEDAPAATDASSTARTAPRRGRRKGWRKDKGKDTSSTKVPRRSTRRSLNGGGRSSERSTAGSSGGGGSIRDSAHDRPRGDEIRTGESYFNIRRWSSAPRDNEEEEPPRQRRKVQWSYVDGSTYVGEALYEKRDGQGTLTRHGGVCDGVFKNGQFDEGTATNVKWSDDCRYTGQIVGGKMNGNGKITFADGWEFEGTFVDNSLREGKKTFHDVTMEGVFGNNGLPGPGKVTFDDGEVHEGAFEKGGLHGPGKITFTDGCEIEGDFAHGELVQGTITNAELANGGTYT
ncbi:hypothetical protein THAOC_14626, partial [Thalassiosira oceanica]